jgi:hypothetical protein
MGKRRPAGQEGRRFTMSDNTEPKGARKTVSEKQLQANRLNSLKSTGPLSSVGRAR